MQFNNSILNQQQPNPNNVGRPAHPAEKKPKRQKSKWLNVIAIVLLVSITLLLGSLIFVTSTAKPNGEINLVNENKFQAVFLNGGQVYFGKIRSINTEYLTMDNIYYLKVNEKEQAGADAKQTPEAGQDVTLARLGCELHGPEDQMIISKSQLMFWENLKDDGQVTKAIAEFVKQNPNGQKCTDAAEAGAEAQPQAQPKP